MVKLSKWFLTLLVVLSLGTRLIAEVSIVIETELGVIEAVLDDRKAYAPDWTDPSRIWMPDSVSFSLNAY